MTREQVFVLIQAHLADELDVDPNQIGDGTRFKEDLEADSLDLYTLVQELEDSYDVRISDEQAAEILTVGQAVDFVLAHSGNGGGPVLGEAAAVAPGRAAGGSGAAGVHARVVDRAARRLLYKAGVPRGQRACAGCHDAPVPAAGSGALRGGPADEDPRSGRVRAVVSHGGRTASAGRAPARGRAAGARPA